MGAQSTAIVLLLILPFLLLISGLVLFIVGLRGRKVDDAPRCRACGFDLTGSPLSAASRCPECGSDLSKPKAVRTGTRHVRKAAVASGGVLLFLSLAVFGVMGWGMTARFNWNTVKPTWMLIAEVTGKQTGTLGAPLDELTARLRDGKLPAEDVAQLVTAGLAVQADSTSPWTPAWGSFLEAAANRGHLSPDQARAFAHHAVVVQVRTRARARASQPIPVQLVYTCSRAGSTQAITFSIDALSLVLKGQDGARHELTHRGGSKFSLSGGGGSGSTLSFVSHSLPPGVYEATVTVQKTTDDGGTKQSPFPPAVHTTRITLVPDGEPLVELVEDASKAAAVRAAFRSVTIDIAQYENSDRPRLDVVYDLHNIPVNISMQVHAVERLPEGATGTPRRFRLPDLVLAANPGGHSLATGLNQFPEAMASCEVVDVVFEAASEPAERSAELDSVWKGTVIIEGVRVKKKANPG